MVDITWPLRTESQVLDQILHFARSHDCIRSVALNGSRVNPNAPRDRFQDYDVVLYVTEPRLFLEDQSWIAFFGDLTILQQNDFSIHELDGYIFLMLFTDGVRIDLSFDPLECRARLGEDSLTRILLDKDGCIPPLPPASDNSYHIQRPTRKAFDETINEALWCTNNIAKGICRDELAYVKYMFDNVVRPKLLNLLEWYAAMNHDWAIDTGAYGKWLKKFLPLEIWDLYVSTYAGTDYEEIWNALFNACSLVRLIGTELSEYLGCGYPMEDDRRVMTYLERMRKMKSL